MISNETVKEVRERSMGRCENFECRRPLQMGYDNHHIFWRSRYRKSDRDDSWNIAALCKQCHYSIHSQGNTTLDSQLKLIAGRRKEKSQSSDSLPGKLHPDITKARKTRRAKYRKSISIFKETHGGLSPSQIAYRRQKAYRASLPK